VEESDVVVKREMHTKCAAPWTLSKALRDLLGDDAEFKVEVIANFSGLPVATLITWEP
jgi:hypothetical protein